MRYKGLLFAAAAAAFAAFPAMTPASAQYYDYPGYYAYYGYGPYYYGPGPLGIAGDLAAGVVGDVLAAPYAGPYPGTGILACERHFRSFDPATGTYTTYSGEQVLCPYLGG
jgi:BA14K-like protein